MVKLEDEYICYTTPLRKRHFPSLTSGDFYLRSTGSRMMKATDELRNSMNKHAIVLVEYLQQCIVNRARLQMDADIASLECVDHRCSVCGGYQLRAVGEDGLTTVQHPSKCAACFVCWHANCQSRCLELLQEEAEVEAPAGGELLKKHFCASSTNLKAFARAIDSDSSAPLLCMWCRTVAHYV